jgi:lysophospholipase L1-like esterase
VVAGLVVALAVVGWGSGPPPVRPIVPVPAVPRQPPAPAKDTVVLGPGQTLRLMPLGDSITDGEGSGDHGGYRTGLDRRLTAAGFRVAFVGSRRAGPGPAAANEGHPGWTIARLATRVTGWLTTARPDIVLLHIGTNDINTDTAAAGAPAQLAGLLDRIVRSRPAAQIFVAELVGSSHDDRQQRIDVYNAAVVRLVAAGPANVHLVDQSGITARLLRDGRHPDDAGYAQMAANWAAAVRTTYRVSGIDVIG